MATLEDRINALAAQEREWIEAGHPVAVMSNDVAWWNARNVFTAEDFDAFFAPDPHTTSADMSYLRSLEADACQWEAENEMEQRVSEYL